MRFYIEIPEDVAKELMRWGLEEYRSTRDQATWILIQAVRDRQADRATAEEVDDDGPV